MRIVPLSPGQSPTRVVAVASGKGGVGKTGTTIGLAWALAKRGNRVCILDADLGLSNVDILLGVTPEKTLEDVLFDGVPMEEAVVNVGPGVDLVSGSSGVPRLAELSRAARKRLIRQFKHFDAYDYLVVDNSPGITGQIVSICLSSRDLVVMTTPDATSIADAYALIKVLTKNGLWWSPFICVNRAKSRQQARLIFEKIRATAGKHLQLDCRYLGCVLEDEAVGMAAAVQKPVIEAAPRSQAALCLSDLALVLDEAEDRGRRRDVSPLRFLDGSIMRLKQDRGALSGIARTTKRFQREACPPPPAPPAELLEGITRLGRGLDRLEKTCAEDERARLMRAMRAELTAMRVTLDADLTGEPRSKRQSARARRIPKRSSIVTASASTPKAPLSSTASCTPGDDRRETLPGMEAAMAALAEVSAIDAPGGEPLNLPTRSEPQTKAADKALLVCPPSPMRELLTDVLSEAGLKAEAVHPRTLNGGDHFAGYRLGLVCWDASADDLRRVVARSCETPVVMLRGFRRKPEHEPDLSDLPVTVLYKPFQVKTLFGAIRRAARGH